MFHAPLDDHECHQRRGGGDDKPKHQRRKPASVSTVAEVQVDPADPQRDEDSAHPVHPARHRATGATGGYCLPDERDCDDSDDQGQKEDGAVSVVIDHEPAEQCVEPAHSGVDRREHTATDAECRRAEGFPHHQVGQAEGDVGASLQDPAHHHDRQRGTHHAQQRPEALHDQDSEQDVPAADVITPPDQHDVANRPGEIEIGRHRRITLRPEVGVDVPDRR